MVKLEDFLNIKLIELISEFDEYEILKSDYYLVKMKENYDNGLCNGYMIGLFQVKVSGDEYLDLTDEDWNLFKNDNLYYKDLYRKGHDLYFMSNDGEIEVDDIDDITYIQKLEQCKLKLNYLFKQFFHFQQIEFRLSVMFGNPETATGGNALKFYASVRLDIRKRSQPIKDGDDAVGSRAKVS